MLLVNPFRFTVPAAASNDYLSDSLLFTKAMIDTSTATAGDTYWDQLVTEANRTDHPVSEFNNTNGSFAVQTFAKALRYVRLKEDGVADATIDGYRTDVATRISDFNSLTLTSSAHLGHARQLPLLVLAADFINLAAHDSTIDSNFRTQVQAVIDLSDGAMTDGFSTLPDGARRRPNNIGQSCRVALTAAYLYLGTSSATLTADVIEPMRRWLGDTSYHNGATAGTDKFAWNANQTWQIDDATESTWVGVVAQGATKDANNFDGIQPEDQRRNPSVSGGADYTYADADYPHYRETLYVYGAAMDAAWTLLMLHRAGHTGALGWSNDAAKRAIALLLDLETNHSAKNWNGNANGIEGASQITVLANYLYGTAHTVVDPADHWDAYGTSVAYSHFIFAGKSL